MMSLAADHTVTVALDVPATMRDGVTLYANVYRPEGDGPWPVLLARTPYGREQPALLTWLNPVATARKGFVVVLQDSRGRFGSEGEWMPFRDEARDGYDAVEWAARLPGANGRVGMYCASYLGNAQWLAAAERPPSLRAIAPAHTWSDPLDGLFARGGALELGLTLPLDLLLAAGGLAGAELPGEERGRRLDVLLDDLDRLPADGYWQLPVSENAIVERLGAPDIGTLALRSNPEIPSWCRVVGRHERVVVPSFNIGAWYDVFLQGTLDNYMAMRALGRPARLVVGPWTHLEPFADPIGERCFGVRATRTGVPAHPAGDLSDWQLSWFRQHLVPDGAAAAPDDEAPVRIFVMGRNMWRDEEAWPPARARTERWLLGAGGALRRGQDGTDGGGPTAFTYDPRDPVPTAGGQTVLSPAYPPGPYDQRVVEARPDVCVFTSAPLGEDLEVTGRIRAVLHVASSAPSTDWVARLCDVDPDGRSYNLCDGITRVASGADGRQRVEIDLWSTSNVFLAGHRVRVHVTSSSFPRWDRNLNTGQQDAPATAVARQQVFHEAEWPSWFELPVVG
jgi:putative CocE/NonD family hydrolase